MADLTACLVLLLNNVRSIGLAAPPHIAGKPTTMENRLSVRHVLLGFAFACMAASLSAREPKFVSASAILDSSILRGPGYEIGETVRIQDNRYVFKIRTEYGDVVAIGFPMLELRLREHQAIQNALAMSKEPLILRGMIDSAKKTPAGAMTLLRDPLGAVARIPRGVKGTIDSVINPLERRAGSTTRRQLAAAIGADPETRNPILDNALNHMTLRKGIGEAATKIGVGMAVPGLGLLSTTEDIRRKVSQLGPKQIAADVQSELLNLGVRPTLATAFANADTYTSTEKLKYMALLDRIRSVEGLDVLVQGAVNITSEAQLLSQIQQVDLIAKMYARKPIKKLFAFHIPIAQLREGQFIGIAAVDIVQDTRLLEQCIADFRQQIPDQTAALLVTGNVSHSAREQIQRANIKLFEIAQSPQAKRQ